MTEFYVSDRVTERRTLDSLPTGTVIQDACGRECELWSRGEIATDWMDGGWPTVPVLPATITRFEAAADA